MGGNKDRYHEAARDNNLDILREATRSESNTTDEDGMTPVLWAAFYGNVESLRVLMSRGANPDKCDYWGNTALHLSAANGHMNCATYLVNVGANIWLLDNDYHTALDLSILNNHKEISDFLDQISAERMRASTKTVQKFREKAVHLAQRNIKNFEKLRGQLNKRVVKESFISSHLMNGNKASPAHASLAAPGSTLSLKKPNSRFTNPYASVSTATQRMKNYSDYVSNSDQHHSHWFKNTFSTGGTTRSGAVAKKATRKKDESNVYYASSQSEAGYDPERRSIKSRAMSEPDLNQIDDSETLRMTSQLNKPGLFVRPGFGSVAFFNKPMANQAMMSLPKFDQSPGTPARSESHLRHDRQDPHRHSGHSFSPRHQNYRPKSNFGDDSDSIGTSGSLLHRMNRLPWSEAEMLELTEDNHITIAAEQMEAFLAAYDLTDLAACLAEEKIDLPALLLCSENDLEKIGLTLGPRRKLLAAVEKRKETLRNPGSIVDSYL